MELLKRTPMYMTAIVRWYLIPFFVAILTLTACNGSPSEWKTPNMTALMPRLKPVFEKTKTVCFGRFMVDVPASATVVWGDAIVPLGVSIYPNGVDEVRELAQKFIVDLKSKKAIYHDHVPLLIEETNVSQPEGKIVTGYDGFEAINDLKINGYFGINNDGVIVNARPMKNERDETIALINSIVRRLRQRPESEIPTESGNCIEHAFLVDEPAMNKDDLLEHIRIGFRLREFPDTHLSIYVAPANPNNPEDESLKAQWKRIKEDPATPEEKKALANTKFFRESPRQIYDWKTGYEVLMRAPDEEHVHSYHDFQIKFTGVPHDPFKPYADVQLQTGVANNAAGATKSSLTDEEVIAIWDKITSTIRVRPTSGAPMKSAEAGTRLPLGELAATGRSCPQTGWWEPDESRNREGSQRQYFKTGERMPHVVSLGEPSIWQKLKGERPSYRTATVWKLVSYDDASARANVAAQPPTMAQISPPSILTNDGTAEDGQSEGKSPEQKG
ncbi:T6SS immunity protein Tli4 family protein [Massilia norwichensis]|uniref:T6SS immunity protein Tli4 family protein n=1 Tax=Massilia norwichensis TaxID=1442366 RepID=A0ABT2A548_9BURK|nr:T6SS immunity protein Tli4 family protein [Massilia norwichensis]MCS0589322.1 T6SS immunity protein Tli4 family protein [Massilia norwichensis]